MRHFLLALVALSALVAGCSSQRARPPAADPGCGCAARQNNQQPSQWSR
ncbi:hypothetical protein [Polyangium sp. 15x6]|nr:hypothetical protein [Polyangium sp. 15x6]MDI3289819.1 hypothetical protein [Polyangium sp. 15x6]